MSAESTVIGISVQEQITRATDSYTPNEAQTGAPTIVNGSPVGGVGHVVLTNNAGITLTNVHVRLYTGNTNNWATSDSRVNKIDTATYANEVDIFIPQFDTTGPITINYAVASTATPPVYLSASYSKNKITDNVGSSSDVTLTAYVKSGILPSDAVISGSSVTITAATHSGTPMWSLTGSGAGVSPSGSPSGVLTWTLPSAPSTTTPVSTTFTAAITDATNLGSSSPSGIYSEPLATSVLSYTITSSTRSAAGVYVDTVTGTSAQVQTQVEKQLVNGKWVFTPQVKVGTTDISYTLSSVTLWACDNSNLGTNLPSSAIGGVTNPQVDTVGMTLNGGSGTSTWTGSLTAQQLIFPYSGIPAGFVKPSISMLYDTTQFPLSVTGTGTAPGISGVVTFAKFIYVINGYDIVATKTITPTSTAGVYNVQIVVKNLGNMATPPDVVVYDQIPSGFTPSASKVDGVSKSWDGYQNMASGSVGYYWNIGQLAELTGTRTITYTVTGPVNGNYQMSDLYVVGVDPAYSMNLQSSPSLDTNATVVNSNLESVMAVGALCLVIIGMIGTVRRKF